MADTPVGLIALAKSGDATSFKRAKDLASVGGTFSSSSERERFVHSIRALLNGAGVSYRTDFDGQGPL
jgi:hypothetical protein